MGEELHTQVGWLPAVVMTTLRISLLEVLQMPVLKISCYCGLPLSNTEFIFVPVDVVLCPDSRTNTDHFKRNGSSMQN